MKNIFFSDDSLNFNEKSSSLTKEEIEKNIPFKFNEIDDFIKLYTTANGIVFPFGAFMYRDNFYKVTDEDYNFLDIGAFLEFSDKGNSIVAMYTSLRKKERTKNISKTHFPFGLDSSGNLFVIQSDTGVIRYLPHESPENITDVAPSFTDFCKNIRGNMR